MGFMAKSRERNKAIKLREQGMSIKEIAKKIGVSKSSASIWCRDIVLTKAQVKRLHESMIKGSYAGRMKGARMQYERRLKVIEMAEINGRAEIGSLSKRDLLISFISLYWGEGSKKSRQFAINNSDPQMVTFIIKALRKLWGIEEERLVLTVGINEIHKNRDKEVVNYWSKVTGVPTDQFRKTIFIKAKTKKHYDNFKIHYGTVTVKVKKSSDIYYKTMGLIKGLVKL
jgi:transcriptional regulator with XRE-family HTH domain